MEKPVPLNKWAPASSTFITRIFSSYGIRVKTTPFSFVTEVPDSPLRRSGEGLWRGLLPAQR